MHALVQPFHNVLHEYIYIEEEEEEEEEEERRKEAQIDPV